MQPPRPEPVGDAEFAALMAPLGPFGRDRPVAVAVSGGADSLALVLLAARWGQATALIVDHGLRPEAAAQAAQTADQLDAVGIPATVLPRLLLPAGPGLAARARSARYAALLLACRRMGFADLLLGHHIMDQAETVEIRRRHGSHADGLAGMSRVAVRNEVRLLRPLLGIAPVRLRLTVRAVGLAWVDDPSNADLRAERARVRHRLADPDGTGPEVCRQWAAAHRDGWVRAQSDTADAASLADIASVREDGTMHVRASSLAPGVLGRLLRTVSGADYPPDRQQVWRIASALRPATLHGVRIGTAGRLGCGWLLAREHAAVGQPVQAVMGARWDRRYRVVAAPDLDADLGADLAIAALGPLAAGLRRLSPLPAYAMASLPAVFAGGALYAVPHLGWPDAARASVVRLLFAPAVPLSPAPFVWG